MKIIFKIQYECLYTYILYYTGIKKNIFYLFYLNNIYFVLLFHFILNKKKHTNIINQI